MHSKIGKGILSKMGNTIQVREIILLPRRREGQQRNNTLSSSSSNMLNNILNDQREMYSKINKLIKKMEKANLISSIVSSMDDYEMT